MQLNHPVYRDITIVEDRLSQLPVDGDVLDDFLNCDSDDATTGPEPDNGPHNVAANGTDADEELPPVTSAVPDVTPSDSEMEQLRQQVQGNRFHLSMPSLQSTPIPELDALQPVLSWAFPTLYPRGHADFVHPRLRSVSYQDYITHLMKFHDGRFARHPRWWYVVFNTLMRKQANQRAGF